MKGKVIAVSRSSQKGMSKANCPEILLRRDLGVDGDAHAEGGTRQVSLLALESIRAMQDRGFNVDPGAFAENITIEGLNLTRLPLGTWLRAGESAVLEISQIGKECPSPCAIFEQLGDCIMPQEGVFGKVLHDGWVRPGDTIRTGYRAGIVTVSDRSSKGERADATGPAVKEMLQESGFHAVDYRIVADEKDRIREALQSLVAKGIPLILTNGGTGLGPRDVTPEATVEVVTRSVPGIVERIRAHSVNPRAALSRAVAGAVGRSLIINLPGSLGGARESLSVVLPILEHALEVLEGEVEDCEPHPTTAPSADGGWPMADGR
jgi:molybdenum cofactor synthesis domain-containing protein